MLTSLALIFLTGLLLASLFEKLKLPRIIGMLLAGILLGPYVLNLLDDSVLSISSDLRQMALIIILIKAGLSLNLSDLKKVSRPAILMSFVPATFEIIGYVLLAPTLLGISKIEAAVMGSVLAAVSPAVVIPRMVQLMETNYGTEKSIPQLIMAGASCDDIFVIVLFSTFSSMAQGGSANIMDFINIPVSILLGIVIGAIIGYLLALFFETCHKQRHSIRSSLKVLILLSLAFLCMALEKHLKGIVAISGLLAVVSMACVVKLKSPIDVTNRLSLKFGKLCRDPALCTSRCRCRHPLYDAGRNRRSRHDPAGSCFPCRRCLPVHDKNFTEFQRTSFLRDRLSSKSNRSGCDRFRPAFHGTCLRTDRALCRSAGDPDHRTAWSDRY